MHITDAILRPPYHPQIQAQQPHPISAVVMKPFKELAQNSKEIHTFRYFLKHDEINVKNGTLAKLELYKKIQLVSLEEFEKTLDLFSAIMTCSQKDQNLWVDEDVPFLIRLFTKRQS